MLGVDTGPPNVDGLPNPASSINTSSTFGAPSGGDGVMLIVQSATDVSSVRPTVPPKFGSGIGSTVRSGLNFPIASAERLLQSGRALLVALHHRAERRARERLLDAEPVLVIEDRDDPRRSRRQVLADLVVDLLLHSVVDELADHPACDRPDRDRRQQRRREQTDREPDPAAPAQPLTTEMVARLPHPNTAVPSVRDQDDALDCDLLVLHESDERFEILSRLVDIRVPRDEHVGRCLSHHDSPFRPAREDSIDRRRFCAGSQAKPRRPRARHPLRMKRHRRNPTDGRRSQSRADLRRHFSPPLPATSASTERVHMRRRDALIRAGRVAM